MRWVPMLWALTVAWGPVAVSAPPAFAAEAPASDSTPGAAAAESTPDTAPAVAPASASGPVKLSIEDVLRLAQVGSEQVTIARAGIRRAEGERVRARSEWYPQLSATAAYDRTLASEYEDLFDSSSSGSSSSDESSNPFADLPFGQDNTYRLGLQLSQSLYSGGRTVNRLEAAAAGLENARLELASARAGTALSAVQAYYDAVLSQQLFAIAEATLQRAADTLEQTRLGRQVGNVPEFDLLRAQVTYENQKPAVLESRYQRDLAFLRLKQLLDLPLDRELELTSALEDGESQEAASAAREVAGVPEQAEGGTRAVEEQAAILVRMREVSLKTARSQRLPSVALTSSYGRVAYPDELFPGWSDFRTNWTVGLSLQVPLFTGFRIRGDVLAAEADLIDARARLKQTRELVQLDTHSAREQLKSARAVWEASAGTVAQAQRAYEIAELRYREGVSTQLELTDARLLLQQAQANRARAARDLQVARIRIALLSNLPLS